MEMCALDEEVTRLEAALPSLADAARLAVLVPLAWHLRQRDTRRALALADEAGRLLMQSELPDRERKIIAARLQLIYGEAKWLAAELDAAAKIAEETLEEFGRLGDALGASDTHWLLAWIAADQGNNALANIEVEAAISEAARAGDQLRVALADAALAGWAVLRDVSAAKLRWGNRFSPDMTGLHPSLQALIYNFLSHAAAQASDYGRVTAYLILMYEATLKTGQIRRAIIAATNVGAALSVMDDHHAALEWMERGLDLARPTGWPASLGLCLTQTAETQRKLGRFDAAQELLTEALDTLTPLEGSRTHALVLAYLGDLALDRRDYAAAFEHYRQLEIEAGHLKQSDIHIMSLRGKAHALSYLGKVAEALVTAETALQLAHLKNDPSQKIEALKVLADIHAHHTLPLPAGMKARSAPLHYLEQAMHVAATIDGYSIPESLLDALGRENAKIIQPAARKAAEPEGQVQRSIFGEILDWMLAPLLLLWPMSITITYLVAKSIANQPFDHVLEDSVTILAQQVKEYNGKIYSPPVVARDILRADDVDNIYFQVSGPQHEYVAGDLDMPGPGQAGSAEPGTVLFRSDTMRGTPIRVAYTYVDLRPFRSEPTAADQPSMALVQVGETLDKRGQLANAIVKGVILPQFIILPITLALVWFALSRGLSPLAELQRRILARRPDDLSPIGINQVPEEIAPLVSSLNGMLERLSHSIQVQKRFVADAAHQMKTPLAGMRMQSELALLLTDHNEIRRSVEQLSKSSEAATRMINQLLILARAENQTPATEPLQPLNLSEMARATVHDWVQASFSRKIDLGFEQQGDPIMIHGNGVMLREMLNNLIDNALRYTPAGGSVTVRVRADEEARRAILEVEDTGPGIAAEERPHVFERFYRILGSNVEGSGLGLSIVREIAQQHNADVKIFSNPRSHEKNFPGCLMRVTFTMQARPTEPDPIA